MKEWEEMENKELKECVEGEPSSFEYHAIPLDKLETLDENGNVYSIKELMTIKDLKEELGE